MNLFGNTILLSAGTTAATTGAAKATGFAALFQNQWTVIIIWVVVLGALYFLLLRPQKKRQKEEQQMRENVQVGDQIITIGGISGRVIAVKEKEVVLETGADRNKITIKKWAIQLNETAHDVEAAAKEAKKSKKKDSDAE
jgi:preprotein translocase subunit YajC